MLATAVFAVAALLYATTACPTIAPGDSAELAAAAAVFGVPHPPGYPVWTLLVGSLVHACPFAEPAYVANLASGLFAAAAAGMFVLLARRLGCNRTAAALAATALATGSTVWSQSTVAEVYTLDALLLVTVLWLACGRERAAWAWPLVGLAIGLWVVHRPVNVLFSPAIAVMVWSNGQLAAWRAHAGRMLAGVASSGLVLLYLPLASMRDPCIDVGDPETWTRFLSVVTGEPYSRHLGSGSTQLMLDRGIRFFARLPSELGIATLPALLSLVVVPAARRRLLVATLLLSVTSFLFGCLFNVHDEEVFFLPAIVGLALAAALATEAVVRRTGAAWVAVALTLGLLPGVLSNHSDNDLSADDITHRYASDLLRPLEPNALLFVAGDNTSHALAYVQGIEEQRPDVLVIRLGYLSPWYLHQLWRQHPELPWPRPLPAGFTYNYSRTLYQSLGQSRPTYLAGAVSPRILNDAGHRSVPASLATQILPAERHLDGRRALAHIAVVDKFLAAGLPTTRIDIGRTPIALAYVRSVFQTADYAWATGHKQQAMRLFRIVIGLQPDAQERQLYDQVKERSGKRPPANEFGRKARRALAR